MKKQYIEIHYISEEELYIAKKSLFPKIHSNGHGCRTVSHPETHDFFIYIEGEDLSCYDDLVEFEDNYLKWTLNTFVQSNSYFYINNKYFQNIVDMGQRAVPFIYDKITNNPLCSPFLLTMLDKIFPDVITINGYCSVKQCRELWLEILEPLLNSKDDGGE